MDRLYDATSAIFNEPGEAELEVAKVKPEDV